jgi:hypothetical protein
MNAVDTFMAQLDHPLKPEIEALRAIILSADPRIRENIKWNAPSFLIEDHFATFKLRPAETIQVVFHTGAKKKADPIRMVIDDPTGLLAWVAPDRCLATFTGMPDVQERGPALKRIVEQWVGQIVA